VNAYQTRFLGEPLVLRAPSAEAAEALAYYLGLSELTPVERPRAKDRVVDVSGFPIHLRQAPEALSGMLLEAVHELAVLLADRFLLLHGCGFVHRGRAVLLCGPSGSGKTTLAMIAEHLGYAALGEDLVAVEWEPGLVHSLALPFRPRPFTRRLMDQWYARHGGSWEKDAPHRPKEAGGPFPLDRLVLIDAHAQTLPEAVLDCTFGGRDPDPARQLARIAKALSGCAIQRCPRVRVQPDITPYCMREVLESWLTHTHTPCPKELFGSAS
jgi:hypothetical protein